MPAKKAVAVKAQGAPGGADEVDEFLRKLDHPLQPVLQELRKIILGANPEIREGIKWNGPSFHFKEYFASTGIRADFVHVVLHKGAKVKDNAAEAKIADPSGLLEWHAEDRCSATFYDLKDVKTKKAAFLDIVHQWIKQM